MEKQAMLNWSETQMRGDVDYPKFKALVSSIGSRKRDIAHVRAWEKQQTQQHGVDAASPASLFAVDAAERVLQGVAAFYEPDDTGITTLNPGVWLLLRSMTCASGLLACVPTWSVGVEGVAVRDLLLQTAFLLDTAGMLSDPVAAPRYAAKLSREFSDDMAFKRGLPIYIDILNGRAGAWLAFIDHMGARSLEGTDATWGALHDETSQKSATKLAAQLARGCDVDAGAAWQVYTTILAQFAAFYTANAYESYTHFDGSSTDVSHDEFRGMINEGAVEEDNMVDLDGYFKVFGVSALSCVADVPRGYELHTRADIMAAHELERQRAAQLQAIKDDEEGVPL